MSILKNFSIILVGFAATVCQAEIAIDSPPSETLFENPLIPSNATPREVELKVEPLRLAIDLVDGSHIIGVPSIKSVTVKTPYAKVDIPLKQIVSINMKGDQKSASFHIQNGDKLEGVLGLEILKITTIFGMISVGTEDIIRLEVASSGRALSETPKKGLMLHYPFNGNANDQSGNRNHGTVNGAILTLDRNRNSNEAYSFNASYIETSNIQLPAQSGNQTISTWFKFSEPNTTAYGGAIVSVYSVGESRFYLVVLNGRLKYCYGMNEYKSDYVSDDKLNDNKWHHAVFVSQGNEGIKQIYIDNILKKDFFGGINNNNTTGSIRIGGDRTENYFTGEIDDVRLYNRALSESEINTLFNEGK